METKDFFELQEEFYRIAIANLAPDSDEILSDVIEECQWQVNDWYNGCSYYAKPEDILVDFFFINHEEAHKFLPLFRTDGE